MNEWGLGLVSSAAMATTWDNEMNFGMNHASGAGLITRLVGLQSSMLPLCYGCTQKQELFQQLFLSMVF